MKFRVEYIDAESGDDEVLVIDWNDFADRETFHELLRELAETEAGSETRIVLWNGLE